MSQHDDPIRRIQVSEPLPPAGIQVSDANGPLFTVDTYDQLRTLGLMLEAIANRRQALTADHADRKRRTFERAWYGLPSASDHRDRDRDIGSSRRVVQYGQGSSRWLTVPSQLRTTTR